MFSAKIVYPYELFIESDPAGECLSHAYDLLFLFRPTPPSSSSRYKQYFVSSVPISNDDYYFFIVQRSAYFY